MIAGVTSAPSRWGLYFRSSGIALTSRKQSPQRPAEFNNRSGRPIHLPGRPTESSDWDRKRHGRSGYGGPLLDTDFERERGLLFMT